MGFKTTAEINLTRSITNLRSYRKENKMFAKKAKD